MACELDMSASSNSHVAPDLLFADGRQGRQAGSGPLNQGSRGGSTGTVLSPTVGAEGRHGYYPRFAGEKSKLTCALKHSKYWHKEN